MKNIKHITIIYLLFIIAALFSCKKDELKIYKLEIDSENVVKGRTSATITASYTYPVKLKNVDAYVSTSSDMTVAEKFSASVSDNVFIVTFSNLQANTGYYYIYEYSNGVDIIKTDVKSFTTDDYSMPTVTTNDVTNITATSATCGGNVTDDGGLDVTARGVCWSTSYNPTTNDSHTTDGTGTGQFTSNITELSVDTKYYVRAYATTSKGTSYGLQREITTQDGMPTVTTNDVTNITATSATCGGNVTDDGGFEVTARGICWSTSHNPTTSDSHTTDGTGTGEFQSSLTNLSAYTTYYVRAYATNSIGTRYGEQKTFKTPIVAPEGAVAGLFSVSATQQIFFSQGNLQYQASSNTWRFATNQYDYIGSANSNISSSYSGWIDLFGWGTSGWNCGNTYYRPWDSNNSDGSLYGPPGQYNLTGSYANSDWGVYNPISNGGNQAGLWRTLTHEEWSYVFNTRTTTSGIRYAKAQVAGVNGVILLPDDWSASYYGLSGTNQGNASFTSNTITASQWSTLEQHGAVFLPAAGYRYGTSVYNVGSSGYYWSASYYDSYYAWYVSFYDTGLYTDRSNFGRYYGQSVRLVAPAEN